MKHYTNTELSRILADIKAGHPYVGVRGNRMIGGYILPHSQQRSLIVYRHYGSSAIKANREQLRWLLETIFDDADEVVRAIYSEYHIDFVPEDERYERIDSSTRHPNVFGK